MSDKLHTPAAPPPSGKNPSTHRIGGSVAPIAGLDGFGKEKTSLRLPGLEPRTVHPVASCYTNYAVKIGHDLRDTLYQAVLNLGSTEPASVDLDTEKN